MTAKKTALALVLSMLVLAPLVRADNAAAPAAAAVTAGAPAVAEAPAAPTAGDVAKMAAAAAAEAGAPPVTTTAIEAPKLPDTTLVDEDVSGFVQLMIDAFNAKNWGVFAGLVIMALVWILKKFVWKALPTKVLPWVAAAAGIVAAVSTGLIAGVVWWQAILNGLLVGAAGGGLWSLVGKHVFGKNEKPEEA